MDNAYKRLKLSDAKKRAIIRAVKTNEPKKKSYVSVVFPAFVIVATSILFLSLQGTVATTTTSTTILERVKATSDLKELFILWCVSLCFLMFAYVQIILLVKDPGKFSSKLLIRWMRSLFYTWKMLFIILMPFVWMAVESLLLVIYPSVYLAQLFVILLLWFNVMLIQLKFVKEREVSTCPYCEVQLTKRELLFDKKCGVCGSGRVKIVQNFKQQFVATVGGVFIVFLPIFQLHWAYIVAYGIVYTLFTFMYVVPYIGVYKKKEEQQPPLW